MLGMAQWIAHTIRCDIIYAINDVSQFAVAPREGHLHHLRKIFVYLKRHPGKCLIVNSTSPPHLDNYCEKDRITPNFGTQYKDFVNPVDSSLLVTLGMKITLHILVNSNFKNDVTYGRSITGVMAFAESVPVFVLIKPLRQGSARNLTSYALELRKLSQSDINCDASASL